MHWEHALVAQARSNTTAMPQVLNTRYLRRLVVMEKVAPYDEAAGTAWLEVHRGLALGIDGIHEMVYAKRVSKAEKKYKKQRFRSKTL
jgi:hypothetical protein